MRQFLKLSPEAQAVAADMKWRGLSVNVGDPLPANLPTELAREIQAKPVLFRLAWHFAPEQETT